MATAPTVSITSISNGANYTHRTKSLNPNTSVTVGDPPMTTVKYYTGPYDQMQSLTYLAMETSTDTSTYLNNYIEFGDSVQYNQAFGIKCVVSNSSGLSNENSAPNYSHKVVFLPVPNISQNVSNNGDGTKTTTFTFSFDNGLGEFRVRVGYSYADGHLDTWNTSEWSSWEISDQETLDFGATGQQVLRFSVTEPTKKETSYRFLLRANKSSTDTPTEWGAGYQDFTRDIFYTTPLQEKLYGPVNNQTREIKKLYGSVQTAVTTVSGDIRSGGEGNITAFDVNTFLSKMESDGRYTDSIEYVKVIPSNQDHGKYLISIYYVDEAHPTVMITPPVVYANMSSYGMTAKPPETATYGHDYIDFTYTTTTQSVSKQITKLYGSVNNQTKLVYQA